MSAVQDFMERARRVRQMGDPTIVVLPVRGDDAVMILSHIETLEANEATFHERVRGVLNGAAVQMYCATCGYTVWFSSGVGKAVGTWNEDGTPHGH